MTMPGEESVESMHPDADAETDAALSALSAPEDGTAAEGEADVLVLDEVPDPDSVLPVWEPTGHPAVDSALEQLHSLEGADIGEHVATFEGIERSLRGTLDGLAAEDDSA